MSWRSIGRDDGDEDGVEEVSKEVVEVERFAEEGDEDIGADEDEVEVGEDGDVRDDRVRPIDTGVA